MLKSLVTTTFRCPYPGCSHQGDSFLSMSDGVYVCPKCDRLAAECGAAGCMALNRPMSRFCRVCGRDLFSRMKGTEIGQRWRDAAQFDHEWRLSQTTNRLGPPELAARLHHAAGFRPPHVLLEWAIVDGVLAIHQGGGILALAHPFSKAEKDAGAAGLIWSQPEENFLALPDTLYEADLFRPFPPTPTAGRRYLLFSTPYAVFAVDLCSLPGWTVTRRSDDFRLLFQCIDRPALRLAAAPVAIPAAPSQVGLVLFDADKKEYSWMLLNVGTGDDRSSADAATVLPLEGATCQTLIAGDQAIAFSTDSGHWVWRSEDALKSNVQAMRRTWPGPGGGGTLVLDQHVERRGFFTWPRQHLEVARRTRDSREPANGFEWCYQYTDDQSPRRYFQSYNVSLPDLEPSLPFPPQPRDGGGGEEQATNIRRSAAIPLGQRWRKSLAETWFIGDEPNGQLYRRGPGVKELSPTRILTVDSTEIDGLRLDDPLLTIVSRDSADAPQRVWLYTLEDPRVAATIDGLHLAADPLVWAHYLFTCERDDEGGISVLRREILIDESSL